MAKSSNTRVFIDASVLVSATLSVSGGSRTVVDLGKSGYITILLTEEIVKEARLSIKKKYGQEQLASFYVLLGDMKESILPSPNTKEVVAFTDVIADKNDRHVLAGAKKYKTQVLVTLDRRHFFTDTLKKAKLPFLIQTPGDFLKEYRIKHS